LVKKDPPLLELCPADKQVLLRLARDTLGAHLAGGKPLPCDAVSPALRQARSSFVTLWQRRSGELRGCRGEVPTRRALIESVARMAIAAATDDPRFRPVTAEELPDLRIEINALTPMAPIDAGDVVVGRHGLMVVQKGSSGLLLPEVPVRHGWGREEFLRSVCSKAGLPHEAWKAEEAQLYGFESEVWGEED
jgi:AmmeMemoRadiSam system protein A